MLSTLEQPEALKKRYYKSIVPSVPESMIRFVYGEGAEPILNGQKVVPKRLLNDDFVFLYDNISSVIDNLLKKKK